ncbi:MAG: hypothetical protein K0R92_3002 [Lachnospiraceae bacterium]|nr:hypothetical protein [Lachnospiraceae bacterium]
MFQFVYFMGMLFKILEYIFVVLGILCFIKYLKEK